jgi:hypothetical protein
MSVQSASDLFEHETTLDDLVERVDECDEFS